MAQRRTKRKRSESEPITEPSIRDTPFAHSNTRAGLLNTLECLTEELLRNQEGTKEELEKYSKYVAALEEVIKSVKGKQTSFSKVTPADLENAGIVGKSLRFHTNTINELSQRFTEAENREISNLHAIIKKIYAHVNMDIEASSRMILDAILVSLAEIASLDKRSVVISPEMRIPSENEVQITHPVSGFELHLSGRVDYAVIEIPNVEDLDDKPRLLRAATGATSVHHTLKSSMGRLFLVEAKRQHGPTELATSIPEAVSQAVSLLQSLEAPEIHFCLSDGQSWIFCVLKMEGETPTYYQSLARELNNEALKFSDKPLREIILLVSEWLRPTTNDLFLLGKR